MSSEYVTTLEERADARPARRSGRVILVELLGPLTMLAGLVWAIAQPYRIAFFYPEGKGVWYWIVQPPLLVVLVGLAYTLLLAPALVDDLRKGEEDAAGS